MTENSNPPKYVLTPEVLARTQGKESRGQRQMLKDYENVNAYQLILTYVPSYRPLIAEELNGPGGFVIHSFWPAYQYPADKGLITARGITTLFDFDLLLPKPEVPDDPTLRANLKKYWRPLGDSSVDVVERQIDKHLKFHKLKDKEKNIIRTGVEHGMKFAAPDGECNLMDIIRNKGYVAGNVYSCDMFVKDLGDQLNYGVKVTFNSHPCGEPSEVMKLHEVHVLYDEDAEEIVHGTKLQSFPENSVFILENLRIRNLLPK